MTTPDYSSYINAAAQKYGVNPSLIQAVIAQESSGNQNASSSAGANGLMQLEPGTASDMGVQDVWDPEQNIDGGTKYLSQMIQKFGGDEQLGLAAYNAGPGRVSSALSSSGGTTYDDIAASLPQQTQDYVPSVQKKNGDDSSSSAAPDPNAEGEGELESNIENQGIHQGISYALGQGANTASTAAQAGIYENESGQIIDASGNVVGEGVGSAANGGTMLSDGSTLGGNTGAASSSSVGSAGAYLAIANDLYSGYGRAMAQPSNKRGAAITDAAGTAAADYFTGGLAGLAINPIMKTHFGTELDSLKNKYDPASISFNDYYNNNAAGYASRAAQDSLSGGGAEIVNHFLLHKSTREDEADNTKNLSNLDPNNPKWQSYIQGVRAQYGAPPPDPAHPFDGKYDTFSDYEKAGLDAQNLEDVEGNLEDAGSAWANDTEAQKRAITQGNIDAGNYYSKDGDVKVSNKDTFDTIQQEVLSGKGMSPSVSAALNGNASSGQPATQIQRSQVGVAGAGLVSNDKTALSNGSEVDFGSDADTARADGRGLKEADFNNPLTPQTVGWTNTIGAILGAGDPKQTSYWAGYFSNAAEANTNNLEGARKNVLSQVSGLGMSQDTMIQALGQLKTSGAISQDSYNSYAYGLGTLFTGNYDENAAESAYQASQQNGGSAISSALKPNNMSGKDIVPDRAIAQPTQSEFPSVQGAPNYWQGQPIDTLPETIPSSSLSPSLIAALGQAFGGLGKAPSSIVAF